jgi:hypothetical protein
LGLLWRYNWLHHWVSSKAFSPSLLPRSGKGDREGEVESSNPLSGGWFPWQPAPILRLYRSLLRIVLLNERCSSPKKLKLTQNWGALCQMFLLLRELQMF